MSDIEQVIEQEIDSLFDAEETPTVEGEDSSSELDSTSTTADEAEEQVAAPDELQQRLQTLGIAESVPGELDPAARTLLERIVSKADERVRGFQSGYEKARTEVQSKAELYDRLSALPQFQKWFDDFRSGRVEQQPPQQEESELPDLEKLPADPVTRLLAVVDHRLEKMLSKRLGDIDSRVSAVGKVVGDMGWNNFAAQNPDAEDLKPQIVDLMQRGVPLKDAYKYAKGATVDSDAIKQQVLTQVREKIQEKKRAGGVTLKEHKSASSRAKVEVEKIAAAEGPEAAFLALLEEAEKAHGFLPE